VSAAPCVIGDAPLRAALSDLCAGLLAAVAGDRVTVRLDLPAAGLDVQGIAAEAVAPGVREIGEDRSISQWDLPTVRRLRDTLAPLVQSDPRVEPGIPAFLQEHYGARAQLLVPVPCDGRLAGWWSVHSLVERGWTPGDVSAAERAAEAVARLLGWAPQTPGTGVPC
jgi:GAF domain-containing protein